LIYTLRANPKIMRQLFLLLSVSVLLLTACGTATEVTPSVESTTAEPQTYVTFNVNVHDWVFPEDSAAAIDKVIDIHEKYQVPVDIYLDEPITQIYAKDYPELIERLKTSSMVAVSYHTRPPSPYAFGFDVLKLGEMSDQERYETVKEYETHALDLTTGETTDAPGGYLYLKELMGYAPYVAVAMSTPDIQATVNKVWEEMGATFTLVHEVDSTLGTKKNGLFLRPETVEVKGYESVGKLDADEVMASALTEAAAKPGDAFINIKWHDDNYYTKGTNWDIVYFVDGDAHGGAPLDPPWDTSLGAKNAKRRTVAQVAAQWALYEGLVKYASEHEDTLSLINARNLVEMLP